MNSLTLGECAAGYWRNGKPVSKIKFFIGRRRIQSIVRDAAYTDARWVVCLADGARLKNRPNSTRIGVGKPLATSSVSVADPAEFIGRARLIG